jgi:UDP-3-O-[3-hydroxymyristoyl] glucosamine N-acyltransferase
MPDSRFFTRSPSIKLKQIAERLKAELVGDEDAEINDINTLEAASFGEISFFSNPKYVEALKNTRASACILAEKDIPLAPSNMGLIIVADPYLAYAEVADMFYPDKQRANLMSVDAHISETATIGANCHIEAGAYIGEHAVIGKGCYIGANAHIGNGVSIGEESEIYPNAVIQYALLGNNVIIHPGVKIGQDGFGFAAHKYGIKKVKQLGRVIVSDFVEIGANSTIDRGAIEDTIIGPHTKIDNLVQIGHNVEIGANCIIVAQVGIAGSTKVGNGVVIGGQVGVIGHINIGNGAKIAAASAVMRDVEPGATLGGIPAQNISKWHRQVAMLKKMIKEGRGKSEK